MPYRSMTHRQSHMLWYAVLFFSALLVLIPLVSIVAKAFSADGNIWPHLFRTALPIYIEQTAILMLGVGLLSSLFGVTTAYLIAQFDFWGRKALEWALILPLAVPTYLIAYIYTDLLEYAGPVQRSIRAIFGFNSTTDYIFFEIRSMEGCIVVLSLVLYPYVYLLARASFLEQSQNLKESSRILGASPAKTLLRVTLPLARPAIIVGVMLVLMEVLNDFGAVHHFAIQTFSEGIYDYWLGRSNIEGASQIALLMLTLIAVLIFTEQFSRRQQALFQKSNPKITQRQPLSGKKTVLVSMICALPVIFGFIIPMARLFYFTVEYFDAMDTDNLWKMAWHSLSLSMTASIVTGLLAVMIAYSRRRLNTPLAHGLGIMAGLGYAIPGAVIAIGVLVPFGLLDRGINTVTESITSERVGLIFSGTVIIIIIAYVVRFLSIAQGTVYAGLQKVTPSMEQSAQTLGLNHWQIIKRVHFPLLNKSILTAMLIVFVDSMKELPATLILRPFNFDTLATNVYQFASDELLEETALPALLIVMVGLLPIIWLNRSISKN